MVDVSVEQDVRSVYWPLMKAAGWLTECAPVQFFRQVAERPDCREAAIDIDLGSEDSYADIPPSPEAGYAAAAGHRAMQSWMRENPA